MKIEKIIDEMKVLICHISTFKKSFNVVFVYLKCWCRYTGLCEVWHKSVTRVVVYCDDHSYECYFIDTKFFLTAHAHCEILERKYFELKKIIDASKRSVAVEDYTIINYLSSIICNICEIMVQRMRSSYSRIPRDTFEVWTPETGLEFLRLRSQKWFTIFPSAGERNAWMQMQPAEGWGGSA